MKHAVTLALVLVALSAVAARAASPFDNISDHLINNPGAWAVNGAKQKPVLVDDAAVQGGKALRVTVPEKGANNWDIAAQTAVTKPVAKGDTVLLAMWVRAEAPAEGESVGHLTDIRVEQGAAPYSAIAESSADVGAAWTMVYASGVAAQDWAQGSLHVSVHLASAKQTIDLGPVFVLDLGQNYDASQLPQNAPPPQKQGSAPATPPWSAADAEQRFAPALAELRKTLPVPGRLIADPSVAGFGSYGPDQHSETVAAPELPGGKALRVTLDKAGTNPWSDGAGAPVGGGIRKNDVVLVAFWANTREANNEAQSGVISNYAVQMNTSPWDGVAGSAAGVPLNRWQMFYGAGVAKQDYPAGTTAIAISLGAQKQTVDLGPAFVLDLGPGVDFEKLPRNTVTYPGRAADAPWRKAAEARIRHIRMGDFKVGVTDADGRPVNGASVHLTMLKHQFHFGTFVGHNIANATGPDADKTRESFLKTFEFATSPLYWSDWGWANPATHANYIASMKWLQDHGYGFRGHPVVYPNEDATPSYVKKHAGDEAAARQAVLDHVREVVPIAAKYGACCLDVVNEPQDGAYLPRIAGADIFAESYRLAHQLAPELRLFINDYGVISGGGADTTSIQYYHAWIDGMLAKGVPVSGIGIQGHFGADLTDPKRVIEILDDFSKYKLPIEITEFDVDTSDEAAQADYTRDMLIAAYSEPEVDAFVVWGWWQGDDWKSNAAMLRKDWSEKPNYRVWMQLIHHDWWTDESVTTGADGGASAHAFYGDYKVTVSANGKTATRNVSFAPDMPAVSIPLP